MGYDAMATDASAAAAAAAAASRDIAGAGKKKRVNRSAKLKQCKLDARREQWLSQGDAVSVWKEEVDCCFSLNFTLMLGVLFSDSIFVALLVASLRNAPIQHQFPATAAYVPALLEGWWKRGLEVGISPSGEGI